MLKTYSNVGQQLSTKIVYQVLKGGNTAIRGNTASKGLVDSGQNIGLKHISLMDTETFRPYAMCGSSKLGDGSICGP